jgi:NADPH-dependent glutamate synthase beta subunit-like oxidoreductase
MSKSASTCLSELEADLRRHLYRHGGTKKRTLGLPGEDAGGVMGAVEFLRDYNMGKDVHVGKARRGYRRGQFGH